MLFLTLPRRITSYNVCYTKLLRFATVLYLRLVYFPFTPMNFGMGLTGVRFRDYLFGTGLGIVVGTFLFDRAPGEGRNNFV